MMKYMDFVLSRACKSLAIPHFFQSPDEMILSFARPKESIHPRIINRGKRCPWKASFRALCLWTRGLSTGFWIHRLQWFIFCL